jgi:hypothetical protein
MRLYPRWRASQFKLHRCVATGIKTWKHSFFVSTLLKIAVVRGLPSEPYKALRKGPHVSSAVA